MILGKCFETKFITKNTSQEPNKEWHSCILTGRHLNKQVENNWNGPLKHCCIDTPKPRDHTFFRYLLDSEEINVDSWKDFAA